MKVFIWCLIGSLGVLLFGQSLAITPSSVNMGKVGQNETHSATVEIQNKGKKAVRIVDVKSNCGCTTTVMENRVLEPGQSVHLDITFSSGYFEGEQEKHVYIRTNEPDQYQLFVYADVRKPFQLNPAILSLKTEEAPGEIEVLLDVFGPDDYQFSDVLGVPDGLDAVIKSPHKLSVQIHPDRIKWKTEAIRLKIKGLTEPLEYTVQMKQDRPFELSPRSLLFMGIGVDKSTMRRLRIREVPAGTRLLSWHSSVDFVICEGTREGQRELIVTFSTVPEKMAKGYGTGEIELKLDLGNGRHETIPIPVAYNIF